MALAFALIKQCLSWRTGREKPVTLAGTCGLQAEQQLVQKTMKPLYPKPHRNQLQKGLRPTLELNTFHRWPGVSCSPLPQGLHQTLLPLQLKLKGLAVRQRRCPGQRRSTMACVINKQIIHPPSPTPPFLPISESNESSDLWGVIFALNGAFS